MNILFTFYRENEAPEDDISTEEELGPDSQDESTDDEDIDAAPATKSYNALLQSLTNDSASAPNPKRRKLNQDSQPEEDSSDGSKDLVEDVDQVDEPEDGPETAVDGLIEEEGDEDEATPYDIHFANPDDNTLSRRLEFIQQGTWSTYKAATPIAKTMISLASDEKLDASILPNAVTGPGDLKLKLKLSRTIEKQKISFNALEASLAPLLFDYNDVLFCERTHTNSESLRRLACLHAINHIFL